jgi:hypothetical protein
MPAAFPAGGYVNNCILPPLRLHIYHRVRSYLTNTHVKIILLLDDEAPVKDEVVLRVGAPASVFEVLDLCLLCARAGQGRREPGQMQAGQARAARGCGLSGPAAS